MNKIMELDSKHGPSFQKITAEDYISLNGVGLEQLIHPFFEEWFTYLTSDYKFEDNISTVIFIPCAAIKPYNYSPIHKLFNQIIEKYSGIKRVVISNAGIIPYEFKDRFPFNSYDWNPLLETDQIIKQYRDITQNRMVEFIKHVETFGEYRYLTFLRTDSDSFFAIKNAFKQLGRTDDLTTIKITGDIPEKKDTDLILILEENLSRLDKTLSKQMEEQVYGILGR